MSQYSDDSPGCDPDLCQECGAWAPDEHRLECPWSPLMPCPTCDGEGQLIVDAVGTPGGCSTCEGAGEVPR